MQIETARSLIFARLILISINISASRRKNKVKKFIEAREQQPRRRVGISEIDFEIKIEKPSETKAFAGIPSHALRARGTRAFKRTGAACVEKGGPLADTGQDVKRTTRHGRAAQVYFSQKHVSVVAAITWAGKLPSRFRTCGNGVTKRHM
jgi:hypothetical protein